METLAERACKGCGVTIEPGTRERNKKVWCGESCRVRSYRERDIERSRAVARERWRAKYVPTATRKNCVVCGEEFIAHNAKRTRCSDTCKYREHRLSRRGREAGAVRGKYSLGQVAAKSSWGCVLCFEPVDPSLTYPDRRAASVDHRVPLSRGGDDTLANVQLAHLACNWSKGASEF